MNKIMTCVSVEIKKDFHSKTPLITMIALMLVPFIGGFFMMILKDPTIAEKMGIISTKAKVLGTNADWPSYLNLLTQAVSVGGLVVFGFVVSWIFGREYSDRTIKDLLALPISRNIIVISKFIVFFLWCTILSISVFLVGLIVGKFINLPGWSIEVLFSNGMVFIICSLLTVLLSTPVAFFASFGRG